MPQGKLVCVWVVGSGKSSLIAGLLGEMKISLKKDTDAKLTGNFVIGSVALVAQKPWIPKCDCEGWFLLDRNLTPKIRSGP